MKEKKKDKVKKLFISSHLSQNFQLSPLSLTWCAPRTVLNYYVICTASLGPQPNLHLQRFLGEGKLYIKFFCVVIMCVY